MLKLKLKNEQDSSLNQEIEITLAYLPQQEFLIGRLPDCQLILPSTEVSRLHAKIIYQGDRYQLVDLQSRGGTRLKQQALSPQQPYPLAVGDRIELASFSLDVLQCNAQGETQSLAATPTVLHIENTDPVLPAVAPMPVELLDFENLTPWKKGDIRLCCVRIIPETPDVKTFCFVAEPPVLFNYKPGQFITLDLAINGESVGRSYSISSTPSRPHTLEITVKRVPPPEDSPLSPPGMVSNWLHDNLSVGDWLNASGPLGKFTCVNQPSEKVLFISAGSGITPMMSMTRWLYDTVAHCDVIFFHNARTPEDIIYQKELENLSQRMDRFKLAISLSRRESYHSWAGLTGRLNASMLELVAPDFRDRTVYVCGPNSFMEGVKSLLESLDFPMVQYHEESFGGKKPKAAKSMPAAAAAPASPPPAASSPGAAPSLTPRSGYGLAGILGNRETHSGNDTASEVKAPVPVANGAAAKASANGLVVVFTKSSKEVTADGDLSILELAEQEGVKIRSSCRAGSCGTCKKRKLEGDVKLEEFDPEALEEDEQAEGFILTCIAYPQGRVLIEA